MSRSLIVGATNEAEVRDRQVLRFGGALGVIGGLGYFVTLLLHGDLPDQTTEIALEHIAHRPEWRVLKLALVVFVLCWVGAFIALVRWLQEGLSNLLGQWAVSVLIVGVAAVVVEYAIMGYAVKEVADEWLAAGLTTPEANLVMAEVMLAIAGGLFHSFVAWMIGAPYVLLGTALVLEKSYPWWLSWLAVIAGSGALLAGTTRFLGIGLVPYPMLYGAFVIPLCLWLAAMGMLMWRRSRTVS